MKDCAGLPNLFGLLLPPTSWGVHANLREDSESTWRKSVDKNETRDLNRRGWDLISASYQAERRISTDDVHYGPFAPGERELQVLGHVGGKHILEVGCGGGQNAVVLAKWGARCTGLDPSAAQLAHARRLAREQGIEVEFVQGIAEDLGAFPDDSFDLVLSSYAFDYVADLEAAYREAGRVLKAGGLFVFCLSHPWFQAVGWHLIDGPDAALLGNYAAWPVVEDWDWTFESGVNAPFRDHLRTLAQIVNGLIAAGFTLERLIEQAYEDAGSDVARFPYTDGLDPASREYEIARKLPRTLVIQARKTNGYAE
jgi:SAM-dependent methyltransferase